MSSFYWLEGAIIIMLTYSTEYDSNVQPKNNEINEESDSWILYQNINCHSNTSHGINVLVPFLRIIGSNVYLALYSESIYHEMKKRITLNQSVFSLAL